MTVLGQVDFKPATTAGVLLLLLVPLCQADDNTKLAQDPTRIKTKLGLGYNEQLTLSGSIALDEARKLNASISEDASEWRLGGSWLFDFGIVNFSAGRNEFDNGSNQTSYSIGTFMPLSYFGFAPLGIQLFPTIGYTYTSGEVICSSADCLGSAPSLDNHYVFVPIESNSGYLGLIAMKPLSEQFTVLSFIGTAKGSNSYHGNWMGAGLGYSPNQQHAVSLSVINIDTSFGQESRLAASYKYEFH